MNSLFGADNNKIKLSEIKKITFTAIFIIIGILLPLFSSHLFSVQGVVFLPMHIPVILCGLVCGEKYGLFCGMITPVLSSLLTGMPSFFPMLPIMIIELSVYGFVIGLLERKTNINIYIKLIITMIAGRLGYALMFVILTSVTTTPLQALTAWTAFLTGLPGIIIQLIVLPIIYFTLRKSVLNKYLVLNKKWIEIIKKITGDECSVIVYKFGKIIYQDKGRGIYPLVKTYEENKRVLRNAYVFDKVIGKGAALILAKAKVKGVYTLLMSEKAIAILDEYGIKYEYQELTPVIKNRDNTDLCPIEKTILDENDLEIGYNKIKEKLKEMKVL